jgi:hypothetical protein
MTRDPSDSRLDLGMDAAITRRDFVNGALVGAGALLTASGPAGAAAGLRQRRARRRRRAADRVGTGGGRGGGALRPLGLGLDGLWRRRRL